MQFFIPYFCKYFKLEGKTERKRTADSGGGLSENHFGKDEPPFVESIDA